MNIPKLDFFIICVMCLGVGMFLGNLGNIGKRK